ncbi:hypothetical protein [Clostridium sp. BJN0001]|uniref:hypothetical protein n=1 Tax=Clostridium sp. BJN0001 TaxID=2930219 RepID=UPI001FD516A8|nr:hypothetical protein [Clostridium sp. BJN0001]
MIKYLKKIKVIATVLALGMFLIPSANVKALEAGKKEKSSMPKIVSACQASEDTIEVTYDKKVDPKKACMPENYWIQSLTEEKPCPIATLGKNGKQDKENSLKKESVTISPKDSTNKVYTLKFKCKIPAKMKYKIIVLHITEPGAENYKGDNGMVDVATK